MNMKSTSRLDDKLNGLLIAMAVGCVMAMNVSALYDASKDSNNAAVQTAVVNYQYWVEVVLAAI